ncbi:MAG: hypothetical protein ACRECZ_02380 [Methylocella sp.]
MVIGDNHFPARREFVFMSMETTICMSAEMGIGAPLPRIVFVKPDRPSLRLPKQKVEKSRVRDARERDALSQANRHDRDRHAATVTSYAHGENLTLQILYPST